MRVINSQILVGLFYLSFLNGFGVLTGSSSVIILTAFAAILVLLNLGSLSGWRVLLSILAFCVQFLSLVYNASYEFVNIVLSTLTVHLSLSFRCLNLDQSYLMSVLKKTMLPFFALIFFIFLSKASPDSLSALKVLGKPNQFSYNILVMATIGFAIYSNKTNVFLQPASLIMISAGGSRLAFIIYLSITVLFLKARFGEWRVLKVVFVLLLISGAALLFWMYGSQNYLIYRLQENGLRFSEEESRVFYWNYFLSQLSGLSFFLGAPYLELYDTIYGQIGLSIKVFEVHNSYLSSGLKFGFLYTLISCLIHVAALPKNYLLSAHSSVVLCYAILFLISVFEDVMFLGISFFTAIFIVLVNMFRFGDTVNND